MDGRAFLGPARHLLAAPSEANWRSATGRGYLAVLHEANAALLRWGFSTPAQDDWRFQNFPLEICSSFFLTVLEGPFEPRPFKGKAA